MKDDYKSLMVAFRIFRRYEKDKTNRTIHASHDIIYAGPNPTDVSEEDLYELGKLGWHAEAQFECFGYYT